MPRQRRSGPAQLTPGFRNCYCDLHVVRGERIPFRRWTQHQDRLRAEQDLQDEEAQIRISLRTFIEGHAEAINDYDLLQAIGGGPSEEEEDDIDNETAVDSLRILYDTHTVDDSQLDPLQSAGYSDWDDLEDDDEFTSDTGGQMNTSYLQFSSFNALDNVADWAIGDESLTYAIKLAIWKLEHRVSNAAFQNRPLSRSEVEDGSVSFYRVKNSLKSLTGLVSQHVPCCANNCAAFISETTKQCHYCGEDVYEQVNLASGITIRAWNTFFYFSPIQRLLLSYASPSTSNEMNTYMAYIRSAAPDDTLLTDFWQGEHFDSIKDLFNERHTLALTLSTDGVQNVRQKSSSVWPILLSVLNFPPELRARNMMVVGLIPGPREPAVFSSFFEHLLADLKTLSTVGIKAYDGDRRESFQLRAHLTVVTGDMPAIAKLMAMKGPNGVSPCRFCKIHGRYSRSSRHWYYPRSGNPLVMRENLRREALMVSAANDETIRKLHGISGLSFLIDIKTLNFPMSFGLDIMHLFSNVAKAMWNIWTGDLLPQPFFEDPEDSYVLTKSQQAEIGRDMCDSNHSVPVFVSRTPRDISKHKNSFKAVDWFEFITIYSCPVLYARLPKHAFISWQLFVSAVRLALKTKISFSEIETMEGLFQQFVDTTEAIYYQDIEGNLAVCTSQLHALLHVGTTIRALGPSYVSWQFGLERFAGMIEPLTTSKSQLNVSLYNGLELLEHLKYARLLYKLDSSRTASRPSNTKDILNAAGQLIGVFTGKRSDRRLSANTLALLLQYYGCTEMSSDYIDWSRLDREVASGTAHTFTVTSLANTSQSHLGRDRCCCMFLYEDSYGVSITSFGRALSFIEHVHNNVTHHLALIQVFNTIEEAGAGALYYVDELPPVLVDVCAIVEPIGRIMRVHEVSYTFRARSRIRRSRRYWIARSSRLELAMQ